MNEPTEESWQELADAAMTRLLAWELTPREKLLAGWLVELSFRRGRESVMVRSLFHFAKLTGLDEPAVSRGLRGLQRMGVLQVWGERTGGKHYRFLPNGLLLQPDQMADPAEVRAAVEQIDRDNAALGPGDEPGGQRRLQISTTDERLADDQAAASRSLSVEIARSLRESERLSHAPPIVESTTRGGSELSNRQLAASKPAPATDAGAYARARNVTSYHGTNHVPRNVAREAELETRDGRDVGDVAGDTDAGLALEQIRELLSPAEFEPWSRKWEQRCRTEPLIVLEAIGDAKALDRVQKVRSWGGTIFKRAREIAAAAGRNLRMFTY